MKTIWKRVLLLSMMLSCALLCGCGSKKQESKELTILAAASLKDVCGELEKLYEEKHPGMNLIFSFGSSGALQSQIEEGAPADIFFSAAQKQMNALKEKGLMDDDSIVDLLENKIVLIVPADSDVKISTFEDAATDAVSMIGLGEPKSVPAGQYAEEVFTTLGILEKISAKANYGQDVRTVLTWVEERAVDCGVVYATDAYSTDKVRIICEAPAGSHKRVIYPVGIIKETLNKTASKEFVEYLKSDEAMELFKKHGFSTVK